MSSGDVIIWLSEGKKVRSSNWPNTDYVYLKDNRLLNERGDEEEFVIDDDMEVYEEKPKLKDQLKDLKVLEYDWSHTAEKSKGEKIITKKILKLIKEINLEDLKE